MRGVDRFSTVQVISFFAGGIFCPFFLSFVARLFAEALPPSVPLFLLEDVFGNFLP